MIKVLTETEYKFLKEFIALIEKYNLLFTTDEKGEIEVTVHRQQLATETNQNSDLLHTPIHLGLFRRNRTKLHIRSNWWKNKTDSRRISVRRDIHPTSKQKQ